MTKKIILPKETNINEQPVEEESTTTYAQTGLQDYNKPLEEKENEPVKSQFELQVEDIQHLTASLIEQWLKVKARLGGDELLTYDKNNLESVQDTRGPVKDLVETRNELYKLFGDIENYNNNPLI